jgi:hypothetical protein
VKRPLAEGLTPVSDRAPASSDERNYSAKAKEALGWCKGKGSDALQSVEAVFSTVTGKAALEKVAAYIQESEAVNTAMATRIYDLLDRETRLLERLAAVEKTGKRHSKCLIAASVVYAASLGLILYVVLT